MTIPTFTPRASSTRWRGKKSGTRSRSRRTARPGVATWDSGFAQPLKIRATALDLSGNKSEKIIILGSSQPGQSTVTASTPQPATAPKPDSPQDSVPTNDSASQGGLAPRQPTAEAERPEHPGPAVAPEFPGARDGHREYQESLAAIFPSAQDVAKQSSAPHAHSRPSGHRGALQRCVVVGFEGRRSTLCDPNCVSACSAGWLRRPESPSERRLKSRGRWSSENLVQAAKFSAERASRRPFRS